MKNVVYYDKGISCKYILYFHTILGQFTFCRKGGHILQIKPIKLDYIFYIFAENQRSISYQTNEAVN